MPPPSTKKPLSEAQRDVLQSWIAQGAEYAQHWAFIPPQRSALPSVGHEDWPRNAIDRFVLQQLEEANLKPAPEAERGVWLRRVTLDLTGLPPTPDELSAFLADAAPGAYERVVDRLLTSPRHAERMAMHWLDAARYADTNGYNNDETRSMWPWRDWVIDAFARGMPYDQFLIEQLAGDQLPDPSLAQRVATGFNRNHVLTTEGGIIEEEYHVEYVADRVHTTATVFMGLSFQCARCHAHKYDPFSQEDYYRFAAYFNSIPDNIVGYSQGRMAEPVIKVPSPGQQSELERLNHRKTELESQLAARAAQIDPEVDAWEQSLTPEQIAQAGPVGLVAHFALDEIEGDKVQDAVDVSRHGTINGRLSRQPGRLGSALEFDGATFVDAGDIGAFDSDNGFSLAAWINLASTEPSTVLARDDESNAYRGYDLIMEQGKVAAHFVHHWPDRGFKVITKEPVSLNEWHHVVVTYDGSRRSTAVRIYVDGQPREVEATTDNTLDGTLKTDKPLHIGRRYSSATFRGLIDDVQLYSVALSAEDVSRLSRGESLAGLQSILALPRSERTKEQQVWLRQYYIDRVDVSSRQMREELSALPGQIDELDKSIPVTMVMQDLDPPRPTYVLRRGQYDQRGEEVTAAVPEVLAPTPAGAPANRLGLAQWLTSPEHPLTARVAVNRWWEMLFGLGLVETVEDFGIQGAQPSHPELLDWLATELVRTGWDQRAILRMIVLSATYRQSSRVTSELLERDPRNQLLARGPRYRLPAESVRDNALVVSGLLAERIGGPSVKPYQPEGLWEDVSVERREKYTPDAGEGLYRRSMYTFWKRTCPPPGMSTFDAPDRETCVIRRARTNTPLQALELMNDPTYVEAARKLAERVLAAAADDDGRLQHAARLVLCRGLQSAELDVFRDVLRKARARFAADPAEAERLLKIGAASPAQPVAPPSELAAWTAVMSVLLNLDEAISKT